MKKLIFRKLKKIKFLIIRNIIILKLIIIEKYFFFFFLQTYFSNEILTLKITF